MLRMKIPQKNEKGQILVIVAVSLFVLLVVIGLAIDSTMLYLNYARLKRAVDAAAIAAANDFKRNSTTVRMKQAALEILNIHEVNTTDVEIQIYVCDDAPLNAQNTPVPNPGSPDYSVQTAVPDFAAKCPKTLATPPQTPRKMVYMRAFEKSQTYFVSLIGIQNIPISTTAIAEAAPIDLVIVLDTSNSMGYPTTPKTPLQASKEAANALIDTLYEGYDHVAVVNFDVKAYTRYDFQTAITGGLGGAKAAITALTLRNDPPLDNTYNPGGPKLFWNTSSYLGRVNPVNPEDRDGDGEDADPGITCSLESAGTSPGRWDSGRSIPCDDENLTDAFDWNGDGIFQGTTPQSSCTSSTSTDNCSAKNWMAANNNLMTIPSTCTGCGIRKATDELLIGARPSAVWVIIFLSDGVANMTDTFATYPYNSASGLGIPSTYKNGFCGGQLDLDFNDNAGHDTLAAGQKKLGFNYWDTTCIDPFPSERWCINTDQTTCPPNTYWRNPAISGQKVSPPYSPEDYARDMTDRAALRVRVPSTSNEKLGNDIAIYTVAFGDSILSIHDNATATDKANCVFGDATHQTTCPGANLLRYMAAVGDDGDRSTDPCVGKGAKESCGQYYYAAKASDLLPIFKDIASRIYTKIAE